MIKYRIEGSLIIISAFGTNTVLLAAPSVPYYFWAGMVRSRSRSRRHRGRLLTASPLPNHKKALLNQQRWEDKKDRGKLLVAQIRLVGD